MLDSTDARPVDLGERAVEDGLDGSGGGAVSVGGRVVQDDQQVEVGHPGYGRASRDAAVQVGTVQPRAERPVI